MNIFLAALFPLVQALLPPDLLLQARCASLCIKEGEGCRSKCEKGGLSKPGSCSTETDPFTNSCVHECATDTDCHGLDKCCPNDCGKTCQIPANLHLNPELPEIPWNVSLQEGGPRMVTVHWSHPAGDGVFYVVEGRENSGSWHSLHRSPRAGPPLNVQPKRGTTFQARVAAINKKGTRGFSSPSLPVALPTDIKPPDVPYSLNLTGAIRNKIVSGLLTWSAPHSESPISRYVVHWSQRIAGEYTPVNGGSVQVHKKVVPHDKKCIRIKNLKLNTKYHLDVQAMVVVDKERVLSKPATLEIDTSNFSSHQRKKGPRHRWRQNLDIQFSKTLNDGKVKAKISWSGREKTKYAITWESVCPSKSVTKSVVIIGSQYVLPDFEENCTYNVFVKEKNDCKKRRRVGKITFEAEET